MGDTGTEKTYYLYSNDINVRHLLVYLYSINKERCTGEIYSKQRIVGIPCSEWDNYSDINFICIGKTESPSIQIDGGEDGILINIQVKHFIDDKKMLHIYDDSSIDFMRQVIISGNIDDSYIERLLKRSTEFVDNIIKNLLVVKPNSIKKFVYNAEDMYWEMMSSTLKREYKTLFMDESEKKKLFDFVEEFFKEETKEEFMKYNIPYKSNVLLYGKPGTGKTSTVVTIASHLNMHVGIIPITAKLDDMGLLNAINSAKRKECNILVLEDIDCLFNNRKTTDISKCGLTLTGLLNCLDGLFRTEGIMIFLTANNVSFIDDAVLRSSRIDYKLYYDNANESQIRQCFQLYFPGQIDKFSKFYDKIAHREVTISMVQEFFFRNRKTCDICGKLDEFDEIIKGISEEQKDSVKTMYF